MSNYSTADAGSSWMNQDLQIDEDQGEVSGVFGEDGMVDTMDPVCHKRSLVVS
jgi:hypothetical protein